MTTATSTGSGFDAKACRSRVMPPIDIRKWAEEHADQLTPPVSNKYIYDGDGFFVMVIGGPNARNDFHKTDSEEYFYQIKGDIVVAIYEDGKIRNVPVREGETFFIPSGVPHGPTRPPGTIGVVVELRRREGETEHQQFYCPKCEKLVYDNEFDCDDIVEHFTASMEAFWADAELSTCKNCGHRVTKPTPIKKITFEPEIVIERE